MPDMHVGAIAGQSMKHHLLTSYFHAVLSVALAQFSTKGFVDGIPGVIRLAKASSYVQVNPHISHCSSGNKGTSELSAFWRFTQGSCR